jgi:hypothetical protein
MCVVETRSHQNFEDEAFESFEGVLGNREYLLSAVKTPTFSEVLFL